MADVPPEHVPPFRCRLCRQAIQTPKELLIIGMAVLHEACLERSTVSDLAGIKRTIRPNRTFDYKGHRLEPQSYLDQDSRRWVPKVFILRLASVGRSRRPDSPWKMLTRYDNAQDTLDAADAHALAMGRRWVDENS